MHSFLFHKADVSPRPRPLVGIIAVLALSIGASAQAASEVRLWHALNPHNTAVFEGLVRQFNRQSKTAKVTLTSFADTQALDAALAMAASDSDRAHLVQLDEAFIPEVLKHRNYIQPLHSLLAAHPIKGVEWFLPTQNTAVRDSKGRLQAFPYMLDIPVMFYNIDAFQKAGLKPTQPERSWAGLQAQLVTAANNGSRRCPITSDQPVSVNLESLAAVNNQAFVQPRGAAAGKGAPVFNFDSLYIRHLSLMISWVRSELLVKPEFNEVAAQRFANGECAVLLSQSSNLGWFSAQRPLDFGLTGLPYYPEVTSKPGLAFVGGSALWATKGHPKDEMAAAMEFLAWLAKAENAAQWYQKTGFLPLTRQAFAADSGKSSVSQQWHALVAPYAQEPVATSRGFQIENYPEIRAMLNQRLDRALRGQEPAVTALKSASNEAAQLANRP